MAEKRGCAETTKLGRPCKMPPQEGSEFCFIHDPKKEKARRAAQRRGGKHRKRPKVSKPPKDLDLSTIDGVFKLLKVAAEDLLACDNGVSRSRALSYIGSVALKARETAILEKDIEEIKAWIRGGRPDHE